MKTIINPLGTPFDKVLSAIDELVDVDTATAVPNRDEVLKWNGTNWVPAVYSATFAMTIISFICDQAATILIGATGTWKATGTINFTASYNNPPPNSASIACGGTGGVTWAGPLVLVTPFTSGASAQATVYPSGKDTTITFTLTAYDGATPRTSVITITFRNNIKYGPTSAASGWDSAAINALAGTLLSNAHTGSFAVNSGASQYALFAHPSSYTSIHATGFLFNSMACPFGAAVTVSVTNASGKTEDYKVYRSTNTNLGNSTLITSTSSSIIDPIYWGLSTVSGTYTEANVEGLTGGGSSISNTKGRSFTVTAGSGQYIVYALPTRLGTVTFVVGGFEGGFEAPQTLAITNMNGYTENYYVYRSTNSNLGTTTVVVT